MRVKILWLMVPLLLAAGAPAGAAQYFITVSANSGGSATPQKGKIAVAEGEAQEVTFTANDGYYLAEVKIDNSPVQLTDRKSFTKQFTDVQKNCAIAARFARAPFIIAGSTGGGTVCTPDNRKVKVFVQYSTSQTFSIQPSDGYHLKDVVVDGVSQGDSPTSWTFESVREKHSLKGFFAINTYTVTLAASPGGKITPAISSARHGQKKVFTVTPAPGMRIKSVTVNGTPLSDDFPANSRPYKFPLTITENIAIAAEFVEIPITLKGTYRFSTRDFSFRKSAGGGGSSNIKGDTLTVFFDGQGGCSASFTGEEYAHGNDTVTVHSDSDSAKSCGYEVTKEGAFTITMGIGTPEEIETVTGWVSTDGNILITGNAGQYSEPGGDVSYDAGTMVGVKAGTSMTKGSLSGAYYLVGQKASFRNSGGDISYDILGSRSVVGFKGNGHCIVEHFNMVYYTGTDWLGNETVEYDYDSGSSYTCAFTVSPAGAFTLNITFDKGTDEERTETLSGLASADGNVVVIGGAKQHTETDGTHYTVEQTVGVKAGSGMSNPVLSGRYLLVGSELSFREPAGGELTSISDEIYGNRITADFYGNGICSVSYSGSRFVKGPDSSVTPLTSEGSSSSCTYSVAANGNFTITLTEGVKSTEINGWVSADGNSVVIGGPDKRSGEDGTSYTVESMYGVRVPMVQAQ